MLWQLILKDLKVFMSDKRALIISLGVPILIACFMTMIFANASKPPGELKLPLLVVDQDKSKLSQQIVANIKDTPALQPTILDEAEAAKQVRSGKASLALVIPKDFGTKADAFINTGVQPEMRILTDPTQGIQIQAIRGTLMSPIMKALFGGLPNAGEAPVAFKEEPQAAEGATQADGTAAHVFGGMAMQALLVFAIEAAMMMLKERRQGIWRRLRAAPVPPYILLMARAISGAIRSFLILFAVFLFGFLVFHIKVQGSMIGFFVVALFASIMAACFGLFVAALGRNEQQSRGLSIFAVLAMLMLGGAWFPSFLMPDWVQKVALVVPVKWAVDGFDAVTWRGEGLSSVLLAAGMLILFAGVFLAVALTRFRWEPETA